MTDDGGKNQGPAVAAEAAFQESAPVGNDSVVIKGIDFDDEEKPTTVPSFLKSCVTSGFQASKLGMACEEVKKMIDAKFNPPADEETLDQSDAATSHLSVPKPPTPCTIWLSFTSNMMSAGLRETFVYLARNKFIDVVVTSGGGVEEDFIKCMAPTYLGSFTLNGKDLRKKGWNRIGNLLVPNSNYCRFQDWLQKILDQMLIEQEEKGIKWTPSKMIERLGKEIDDPSSLYYWCYKNDIPVFCPGITDGSLGDNLYFHSYRNPGLVVDVVADIRAVNDIAVRAKKSGIIILGGGIAKHHTCNANLMRNGADFAVYMNTAQEFDGCDSGASPDEAVSWGKIRMDSEPVKVCADATIVFPLLVAGTFATIRPNEPTDASFP